jgi:hypothetical protein
MSHELTLTPLPHLGQDFPHPGRERRLVHAPEYTCVS